MSELGSIDPAARVHQRALQLLRARLQNVDSDGLWSIRIDRLIVRGNQDRLMVHLDGISIYRWSMITGEVDVTYKPERLELALELFAKLMVLDDLADV